MDAIRYEPAPLCPASRDPGPHAACAIDRRLTIRLNGSAQQVRICGDRADAPPLLVVQAGPGLPLLAEVGKFQRTLALERHFTVCYWDQRGCGLASPGDAKSVSVDQQVDDLRALIRWAAEQSGQRPMLLGISLGASISLMAAEPESDRLRSVVTVSPDLQTAQADTAVARYLNTQAACQGRIARGLRKLGSPPYPDPARFQLRARMLADLGVIESGQGFSTLLRQTVTGLLFTYGPLGAIRALRNMVRVQARLLPELVDLDLYAALRRLRVPVHHIIGARDPLIPDEAVQFLRDHSGEGRQRVTELTDAGHMAHFDRPDAVRSLLLEAVKQGA